MIFKDYSYSVLIVSAAEKFNVHIKQFLPESDFYPIKTVKTCGEANRVLLENKFDIILINSPLPDGNGTELAIDASVNADGGVLLFVKNDIYDDVTQKVSDMGILTLSKPVSASFAHQALNLLYATAQRLRNQMKKTATFEEKMEEIRTVNRAKWLLIERLKMSEEEAHKYIEKRAMNDRASKGDIARTIIKTYE